MLTSASTLNFSTHFVVFNHYRPVDEYNYNALTVNEQDYNFSVAHLVLSPRHYSFSTLAFPLGAPIGATLVSAHFSAK